jgi:hypothetical protein
MEPDLELLAYTVDELWSHGTGTGRMGPLTQIRSLLTGCLEVVLLMGAEILLNMDHYVAYEVVTIKRLLGYKLVQNIKNLGIGTKFTIVIKVTWVYAECCIELKMRIFHGFQKLMVILSHMMSKLLNQEEPIISQLLDFIVWRQFVLHVEL